MSIFKNKTEKLEYDYKCEMGIHHALTEEEHTNFVEWLAVRASVHNGDYTKCAFEVIDEIVPNKKSKFSDVVNILKKHFA